jgi:PAP2 superfamily protein
VTPNPEIALPAVVRPVSGTAYRVLQIAAIVLGLMLMAGILHMGEAAYIAFALAGAFLVHMVAGQPARNEVLVTLAGGAGFAAIYVLHHGSFGNFFGRELGLAGAFAGMGSLTVLSAKWIWAPAAEKRDRLDEVRNAGLIPLLCVGSMVFVGLAMQFTPITYDRLLYVFDLKYGGPPSWVIGRLFRLHPWIATSCGYVYNSLPLGMAACVAVQWRDRRASSANLSQVDLRYVAIALGVTGFFLYQICPAAGPVYLFGKQFPFEIPDLAGFAIQPAWLQQVPRNGMPSLHVGWTLLLFWNMRRRSRWVAAGAALYLLMTGLATLGFGEHYLADLMVAPPLALAIQAACTRIAGAARWSALAIGGVVTLGWLIVFRTGAALAIPAGAGVWILTAITAIVPIVAAWRLERSVTASVSR